MAQEVGIGEDALEFTKAIAKAEKELKLEEYVRIVFYRRTESGESLEIFRYEIPKHFIDRWGWVIQWRRAKLICKYPRGRVYDTFSTYYLQDRTDWGFTADLKQLVALKGKITLQERNVAKYLASKQGELFFDKENDAMLQKILAKVERAKQNVAEAEQRLADKVEQYQKEQQ
jgi:hypothetical protein